MSITTYQPDTKSNPNPNPNPNPTTKQHAIVTIEINIVTCPAYPDKFIQSNETWCCTVCATLGVWVVNCNCHSAHKTEKNTAYRASDTEVKTNKIRGEGGLTVVRSQPVYAAHLALSDRGEQCASEACCADAVSLIEQHRRLAQWAPLCHVNVSCFVGGAAADRFSCSMC